MTAIFSSIILNILRFLLIASLGWMAQKNWIDAKQSATITDFFNSHAGQASLFIIALTSAVGWKVWVWLSHFKVVQFAQQAMGVKATGVVNSETLTLAKALTNPVAAPSSNGVEKVSMLVAFIAIGLSLSACNSFEPASTAQNGDGKVPVKVVASANVSGSTADSSDVGYTGGVQVVFGMGVTPAERSDILTRARALGVDVVAKTDASLGRAAHIHFGHKVSKEKRNALRQRFGLPALT